MGDLFAENINHRVQRRAAPSPLSKVQGLIGAPRARDRALLMLSKRIIASFQGFFASSQGFFARAQAWWIDGSSHSD
jgi:hypothetical protein